MKYIVNHIPRTTPHNRRPGLPMAAQYITIHNTGNERSTAANERSWLTNPTNDRTASYHIVIDENQAIECLPLTEAGWHAGDGINGTGNRKSIGIEICESGDYLKTLQNAAQLVAKLLKERGWGVDRLRRHYDWSEKVCPRLMYDKGTWAGWTAFREMVRNILQEEEPMTPAEKKTFDDLQDKVELLAKANTHLGVVIDSQAKQIQSLKERIEAPDWFVKEFGSNNFGGIINDPLFTKEGWRVLAICKRLNKGNYFS